MKQLLTWCGSQALPEKPSGEVKNANAIMAARAIQQELIDDFANRPELSDWFSREETAALPVVKKPNPTNEKNKITLQELEEEIKRYEVQYLDSRVSLTFGQTRRGEGRLGQSAEINSLCSSSCSFSRRASNHIGRH